MADELLSAVAGLAAEDADEPVQVGPLVLHQAEEPLELVAAEGEPADEHVTLLRLDGLPLVDVHKVALDRGGTFRMSARPSN